MFRQRLLTAIVLVPLVLFAIYYTNSWIFASVVLILLLACAYEWLALIPVEHSGFKIVFLAAVILMTWLCHFYYSDWLIAGLVLWGLITAAILAYPKSQNLWGYPLIIVPIGLIVLPLFAQSLLHLYHLDLGKDQVFLSQSAS
jgi:phosphatidate cytidylyltransferase